MNPLQTLLRQIGLLIVSALLGQFVSWGILSVESADSLSPTMLLVVDHYLPIAFPVLTTIAHQIYLKLIGSRIFDAARQLRAGVTEKEVNDVALGKGGKRTAARILGGVQ